jgi:hypothetical protein
MKMPCYILAQILTQLAMKKLMVLISISLLVSSLKVCYGQSTVMSTLNGYTVDDANKMVNAYLEQPGMYSSTNETNVWFSKAIINSIDTMLHSEIRRDTTAINKSILSIPDGIRIYFAKDFNGGNVIVVSTCSQRHAAADNTPYIHHDYFTHRGLFLSSSDAQSIVDHGSMKGTSYTDTYIQACPGTACITNNGHFLPCADTKAWIRNYDATAQTDTVTSEWFDLKLIDLINTELQNNANADGLRIYYASKVKSTTYKHCFIIINTTVVNGGLAKGGYSIDDYSCPPQTEDFINISKTMTSNDNGEQCPTNCSGVTWPAQ